MPAVETHKTFTVLDKRGQPCAYKGRVMTLTISPTPNRQRLPRGPLIRGGQPVVLGDTLTLEMAELFAEHVVGWTNVYAHEKPAACTWNLAVAMMRFDKTLRQQVIDELDAMKRDGILA